MTLIGLHVYVDPPYFGYLQKNPMDKWCTIVAASDDERLSNSLDRNHTPVLFHGILIDLPIEIENRLPVYPPIGGDAPSA